MSQKLNAAIAVIGIDIGKNSFHIVGHDHRGAIVLRQKWSRGQVETRLANLPPCLIGMEACVGAHHLGRKLQMLSHDARLMPAKYVRPYSKGQKRLRHVPLAALSYSAAISVFFVTELLGVNELPQGAVVDLQATFAEFSHQPAYSEVRLDAAGLAEPPYPVDRRTDAPPNCCCLMPQQATFDDSS
jgi:hypothetical protein